MDGIENAKSLIKGSGLTLVSNGINAIFGVVTSSLIARALGVEGYGLFSFTILIFAFALTFGNLGVSTVTVKLIAERAERSRSKWWGIAKSAILITLVVNLLFAILLLVSAGYISLFFGKEVTPYLRLAALGVVFAALMNIIMGILLGLQRIDLQTGLTITHNFLKLGFVFLLLKMGILGAMAGIIIAYILTVVLGGYFLRKHCGLNLEKRGFPRWNMLSLGFPIAVFGVLASGVAKTSVYMLGFFSSATELGIYGGAYILAQVFFMIPDAMNNALLPLLSRIAKGRKGFFRIFSKYTLKFGAMVTFPIIVYFAVFAPSLISVLLRQEYSKSAGVLQLLSVLGFGYFFYGIFSNMLIALGKQKKLVKVHVISLVVIVILGILLVPKYGASGAALADGIAYLVAALNYFIILRKNLDMKGFLDVGKIVLASLAVGVFLYVSSNYATSVLRGLIISFFSVVFYLALMLLLKVLRREDMRNIYKIIGRTRFRRIGDLLQSIYKIQA